MPNALPVGNVLTIQLTAFQYDFDFEYVDDAQVEYKIVSLNRFPPDKEQMDILINVVYWQKDRDTPILTASCVTSYRLIGIETGKDAGGERTITIPEELNLLLTQEAIAHTRALIALHTAATPFNRTHIAVAAPLSRTPKAEPTKTAEARTSAKPRKGK